MALQNLSSFHCAHAAPDFQICKTNDNCEEQLASASCIFLARFQVSMLSIHTLYDRWISQPYESIKHLPNQPHNRAIFLKEQSISLYGMSTVYGEALRDIEKRGYEGDWQPIGQALNR